MQTKSKAAALAIATASITFAVPAVAAPASHAAPVAAAAYGDLTFDHHDRRGRHRDWNDRRGRYDRYDDRRYDRYDGGRYYNNYESRGGYYGEPVHADTRIWRGNDGRYYCRRSNGTTGLLIGAAGGALLGREIAGRYGDRTLGAILGAAGGAILGRAIDRGSTRCR